MTFADTLKQLPPISHLAGLQLINERGHTTDALENKPGHRAGGSRRALHRQAAAGLNACHIPEQPHAMRTRRSSGNFRSPKAP